MSLAMFAPDTYENICRRLLKKDPLRAPTGVALQGDLDLNPGMKARLRNGEARSAAVLIALQQQEGGFKVILTRRARDLPDHAGQISFPGGSREPGEAAGAAALREAYEEIGLPQAQVHILGGMPPYLTSTGFEISPVIGLVEGNFHIIPDEREVAEVFHVPLEFLINSDNHKKHSREFMGQPRIFYAIPYKDYYIWGATAAMIVNLSGLLADYGAR